MTEKGPIHLVDARSGEVDFETERRFLVQIKDHETYVTDQDTGQRYLRTEAGGWFWLSDLGSPFDEDAIVNGEPAEYLSSIVKTAQESHQE